MTSSKLNQERGLAVFGLKSVLPILDRNFDFLGVDSISFFHLLLVSATTSLLGNEDGLLDMKAKWPLGAPSRFREAIDECSSVDFEDTMLRSSMIIADDVANVLLFGKMVDDLSDQILGLVRQYLALKISRETRKFAASVLEIEQHPVLISAERWFAEFAAATSASTYDPTQLLKNFLSDAHRNAALVLELYVEWRTTLTKRRGLQEAFSLLTEHTYSREKN